MPRRPAARIPSDAASTRRDLIATIRCQSPSTEALDTVEALYVKDLGEARDDWRTLECLRELDTRRYLEDVWWPLVDVVPTVRDGRYRVKKAYVVSVLLLGIFRAREGNGKRLCADHSNSGWCGVWGEGEEGERRWRTFLTTLGTVVEEAENAREDDAQWTLKEQTALTHFLILCFQNLEVPLVASSMLQMTSLSLWTALSPTQRALEFQTYPKLERHWNRIVSMHSSTKKELKASIKTKRRKLESTAETPCHEQFVLVHQLDAFVRVLKAPVDKDIPKHVLVSRLRFVASFLALLIDLLSQLPTRRFLLTVLRRRHIRTALRHSVLVQYGLPSQSANDRQALNKQLTLLDACVRFPVDAHTGTPFSPQEFREHQDRHIQALQQCAFQSFRNSRVEDLAIAPCGHIANASRFTELLKSIVAADRSRLSSLAIAVGVVADQTEADAASDAELIDFFTEEYSVDNNNEHDALSSNVPVFPTELDIWNEMLNQKDAALQDAGASNDEEPIQEVNQARSDFYSADDTNLFPVLPVRKLGLQFLNLADYLQRNFELLRLEAAQDIRGDLEAAIMQLNAVRALRSSSGNDTIFRGFSRFSVPLASALQIVKVGKPSLGQAAPASVIAQLEIELSSRHDRKHFDCYQAKEVVFLVTVRASVDEGYEIMGFQKQPKNEGPFPERFGVQYVRAAEVMEVTDAFGVAIDDANPVGKGSKRMFKLALDGVQYKNDLEAGRLEAYEQVNLLVRRRTRTNNFKAVLDTIRGVWRDGNKEELLPAWLHDLFLGYGDPTAALYKSIYKARSEKQLIVPMGELLLDGEHALEAGGAEKLVNGDDETQELSAKDAVAPFSYVENIRDGSSFIRASHKKVSAVHPSISSPVRFTKAQVTAVRTGACEGLTLVVGPPGTGKTDVAVQLVLNIYRSTSSREKVLIVAHSKQALDDFFAKMLAQNVIHEAEIVRMEQPQVANEDGSLGKKGEGAFHANFSCNGRVAFLLERRATLLAEVEQMAQWLIKHDPVQYAGLGGGSASYSCENALVFYQFHMKVFLDAARESEDLSSTDSKGVALKEFFALRKGEPPSKVELLRQFAVDIESYFAELRRLQPFELLQTPRQRSDMYLIHHARIVAMTCTHVAIHYSKLVNLSLKFGSLIMEEAAQISELDSLIPLLLACSKKAGSIANEGKMCSRLKRVVLLGDAKQLPPAVKSLALKSYAHFDQSLFTRFLRLGVPPIVLDRQGCSRSELADIYRWRYDDILSSGGKTALGDLPRVTAGLEYQTGNVGFLHVAQLVDLSKTSEERQPRPFAYENEEEARFIVALFQYMIGIGYRADQVVMLTTYNAQKELLQRLLRANAPDVARTCQVSTIDGFQGQQKDFVLLSTVRCGTSVGHLRDVRRALTGFSRARLGLYVMGCLTTLEQARELQPFLSKLVSVATTQDSNGKETQLALLPSERVGAAKTKPTAKKPNIVHVSDRKQLEKVVEELKSLNK